MAQVTLEVVALFDQGGDQLPGLRNIAAAGVRGDRLVGGGRGGELLRALRLLPISAGGRGRCLLGLFQGRKHLLQFRNLDIRIVEAGLQGGLAFRQPFFRR